ncbi:MAG TPA: hypothetical protein VHY08_29320, partial [Bacillota bacterium]|nr:hypothetical protein [Bacillota bacterium]
MINTVKQMGSWVYRNATLRVILIAICGTLLFIHFFAHTTFKYHSLTFDLTARIGASGGTVIAVPPVGRIFLETHRVPWQLVVTLSEIDFQKLEEQLSSIPPQEEWRAVFQHEATKALLIFCLFWESFFQYKIVALYGTPVSVNPRSPAAPVV